MLHDHVLNGGGEGMRSLPEMGWASSNAEKNLHIRLTTPDKLLCGNTCRVTRLGLLGDRWRKCRHSNILL
jgi:hypothetical protein